MVGPGKQASIDTHVRNAVTLAWGSFRLAPIIGSFLSIIEFGGGIIPSPTLHTKQARSPLEVFNLLVTVMLLESIVTQTVLLAKCKKAAFSECYLEELLPYI